MPRFFGACAGLCITMILLGVPTASRAQQGGQDAAARLRSLAQAIHMYASENKGFFPPDLAALAKHLGPPQRAAEIHRDVVYVVAPGTRLSRIKQPASTPVALIKQTGADAALVVLFADGVARHYGQLNAEQRAEAAGKARHSEQWARAAVTRPAPLREPLGGDLAKSLIGAWQIDAGAHVAAYEFHPDGTFTLQFTLAKRNALGGYDVPGSGKAAGTWRLDDRRLVMNNTASQTPFTVVGEAEEAQVVRVTAAELVLRTTARKGNEVEVTLKRVVPFRKGQRDNEKIIGTWHGEGTTLVLAESGMAVYRSLKGEWAQVGNQLTLQFDPIGEPLQQRETLSFQIDLLNDTTLVLTSGQAAAPQRRQCLALLRVK
jgi:hypothetical protein